MKQASEIRQTIRAWVEQTSGKLQPGELQDTTPILEQRIVSSLQIIDMILMLEALAERPIDVADLKPGAFKDIETICQTFMGGPSR
jgi:acyl carrier protein